MPPQSLKETAALLTGSLFFILEKELHPIMGCSSKWYLLLVIIDIFIQIGIKIAALVILPQIF